MVLSMSEDDEFAAFDIDVAHLPYITALPPSPATPIRVTQSQTQPQTPTRRQSQGGQEAYRGHGTYEPVDIPDATIVHTPKSAVSDEFAAYDLSEFTADDLDTFDQNSSGGSFSATLKEQSIPKPTVFTPPVLENVVIASGAGASCSSTPPSKILGGPAIDIQVEQPVPAAGSSVEGDLAEDEVAAGLFEPPLPDYKGKRPMRSYFAPRPPKPTSPFRMFRGWASILAVTDLVAPTWSVNVSYIC